jgi:ABC-2 type transport system ATP-binding protein
LTDQASGGLAGDGEGQRWKVIEARNLTKRYGEVLAVDDLSFEVLPGRVTGFLGPNGAGKSTTMRMILGLDAPDHGQVTVNGRPYRSHHRPLFELGALLEAKAVHGGRSAYNHLLALAQTNGIPRQRVDEVLELVGLSGVARKRAGTFSLGMAQRLGIATALLGDPGILILDEPVNGLDPEGILWIRTLLRRFAGEGRAVFISSHLMSEMALTADHLVVIGRGRLIADCSVSEFIDRNSAGTVRVRSPQLGELARAVTEAGGQSEPGPAGALLVTAMDCAAVGDLAAKHGIALHELVAEPGSLEEAFMGLTKDTVEYHAGAHSPAAGS